ncbi:MAG: hypothetical protein KBD24_03650 [Candidatus Pacebacteria bacterium]|nr:hypothetical protein [Candidatus Paceibacterota bacterium]
MPLRTQHPARQRQPHSEAPVSHEHAVRQPLLWLDEVKQKSRKVAEEERILRRNERALVRAAKHVAIISPPGLDAHLERKHAIRLEAERACAQASHEREQREREKERRARRRSRTYYMTWLERLERYVDRRTRRRRKHIAKRLLEALEQAKRNILAV